MGQTSCIKGIIYLFFCCFQCDFFCYLSVFVNIFELTFLGLKIRNFEVKAAYFISYDFFSLIFLSKILLYINKHRGQHTGTFNVTQCE